MSWFGSKTPAPTPPTKFEAPKIDYGQAKFDQTYVQQLANQAAATTEAANKAIQSAVTSTTQATFGLSLRGWLASFLGIIAIVALAIVLYDTFAPASWPNIFFARGSPASAPPPPAPSQVLNIISAEYGETGKRMDDVTGSLKDKIVNGILPGFKVTTNNLGLDGDPLGNTTNTLYVVWSVGTGAQQQANAIEGTNFPTLPAPSSPGYSAPASPPTVISKLMSYFTSGGSGDLLSIPHNAMNSLTIAGNRAPMSSEKEGAYGMQWWMFVKDWNYGYGKDKSVVRRSDPTNQSIMNPSISLHPTDNSLRVSVSLFPSSQGGASKSAPAPAGHSGSTDDVFFCDVSDIPLQTWFSVSVSVFGRNVDVYIDGKLVKSCFLPGVPKPASGDIILSPDGGFSGKMCNFYHMPRMLTPGDAMNFWSAGTSCTTQSDSPLASATGYSVKFGVYDQLGKEVQEYAF
jgi:hypothetical protein